MSVKKLIFYTFITITAICIMEETKILEYVLSQEEKWDDKVDEIIANIHANWVDSRASKAQSTKLKKNYVLTTVDPNAQWHPSEWCCYCMGTIVCNNHQEILTEEQIRDRAIQQTISLMGPRPEN